MYRILTLNMGATSIKVSLFEDETKTAEVNVTLSSEETRAANSQRLRLQLCVEKLRRWLEEERVDLTGLDAAVVRMSGLKKCNKGGVYQIGPVLERDIDAMFQPDKLEGHLSRLGLHLLRAVVPDTALPVYIVDSPFTDEFTEMAHLTGLPEIRRTCIFHALNQKAVARKTARAIGKDYSESCIVVAHMGGGVSVGAHDCGRTVDAFCAGPDQNGPFSTTRSGALPVVPLVELCYSGRYTKEELVNRIMNQGGFSAHIGETDLRVIEQRASAGDEKAELLLRAFTCQMAQAIASQCAVLGISRVDAIALTGGMAHSERVVWEIRTRIEGIAPVYVFPGEEESEAMAAGALRVLRGEETAMLL